MKTEIIVEVDCDVFGCLNEVEFLLYTGGGMTKGFSAYSCKEHQEKVSGRFYSPYNQVRSQKVKKPCNECIK